MSANTATPNSPAGAGSSPSSLFGIRLQFVGKNWNEGEWKTTLETKRFRSKDEADSEGRRIVKMFPSTFSAYRAEPVPNVRPLATPPPTPQGNAKP
jgi:hypothetical protein